MARRYFLLVACLQRLFGWIFSNHSYKGSVWSRALFRCHCWTLSLFAFSAAWSRLYEFALESLFFGHSSKIFYLVHIFAGVVRWALPTRPVCRFPRARCLFLGNSLMLGIGFFSQGPGLLLSAGWDKGLGSSGLILRSDVLPSRFFPGALEDFFPMSKILDHLWMYLGSLG